MITVGWFSPISEETGIALYSNNLLTELKQNFSDQEVKVIVFHPETDLGTVSIPYPNIELTDSLLRSDFSGLFDIAVYHIGNNDINHGPIYKALMKHPGIVVLHDYVYQHYLAGKSIESGYIGSSFASLIYHSAGSAGLDVLDESGVLRAGKGDVRFTPWESSWATKVPLCDNLARLGIAALVHSNFSASGLSGVTENKVKKLFLPRPTIKESIQEKLNNYKPSSRVHLVCTGHIGPTKGIDLLVKAFSTSNQLSGRFKVTIAGHGSDVHYLEQLRYNLVEYKLAGTFDIVVGPSDDELFGIMAEADVFFNLRYPNTEGASLSLVEQLAFGKPILAYRSGCYAEIPDTACFFVDKIDCHYALADSLDEISNDKKLSHKGEAAAEFVSKNTNKEYIKQFVNFVQEIETEYKSKNKLLESIQANEDILDLELQEAWLKSYFKNKTAMQQFYDNRYLIPDGFWELSPTDQGRFLSLNILHSKVNKKTAKEIGDILQKLSLVDSYELVGKLVLLAKMYYTDQVLVDDYLLPLFFPIQDLNVWEIIGKLSTEYRVAFAVTALTPRVDKSVIYQMQYDVPQQGFNSLIIEYIKELEINAVESKRFLPIVNWFKTNKADEIPLAETLAYYPYKKDVVDYARENEKLKSLAFQGFKPVESAGLWSASKNACIALKVEEKISSIVGECSLFHWDDEDTQQVSIVVESLGVGIVSTKHLDFPSKTELVKQWSINLSKPITGAIIIRVEIDKLLSPSEISASEDTRKLGALVKRLKLIK